MSCVRECVSVCLCECEEKEEAGDAQMLKILMCTPRQPDTQAASQRDKDKVKGAGGETGGLSVDLASGQSRRAGRQSNGQVQQPNRQKEEKCLRRTTARLSKATHSY